MLFQNIKHLPDYTVSTQNHMRTSKFINASKTSDSMTVELCVFLVVSSIQRNVTLLRIFNFF